MFEQKRRVLITGGSGFIGRSISEHLVKNGFLVRVLDNLSRTGKRFDESGDIEWVSGDVRNFEDFELASQDIGTIIHLAYINGTSSFYTRPSEVLEVAVKGMQNLVRVTKTCKIKKLLIASSSEVYQDPSLIPTPENVSLVVPDIFNPRYSYGLGKIYQEFSTIHDIPKGVQRLIFRPHNVYGPNMGNGHVIPHLFEKIWNSNGRDLELLGDGSQSRAFCFIDDFVKGIELILNTNEDRGIYNIGTGRETRIIDLACLIMKIMDKSLTIRTSPAPNGEPTRRVPDIKKLEDLGYKPQVSLEEGLGRYYNWFKKSKLN